MQVEAGDFYALLGPNGAGKSTTIGIISSLVNKTSGRVSVFGYDLEKDVVNAKRQLGLVPQEFNFNPFETVQQIVVNQAGYYGVERKEAYIRSEKYLKQLDLWGKRNERARMLSGGMKRRLMIARALMHEPKLLILDEPTAGVDIELRRSMWGFLKDLNDKGTTIILTTHYLEEAEMLCRNIGIIQHGELVENTSMKALLAKLKSETFILDLAPKSPLPKLDGYQYRLVDTATLEVEVLREQGINSVFTQLSEQGIQVLSMRIWVQTLVPPVITMTLYFIIFGNLIGSRIGDMHGFSYMQFIVPGLIMMSVITNAYANVASSFFGAKFQRNIEELLVAPVPTHVIIAGYVGGGVARGLFVGILVTAISLFFVPFQVHSWVFVALTLVLTAVLFSLAGLLNGVFAKTFDDISLVPTFVLTPLTYLGGVFYSLTLLPPFWQGLSHLNPIVYMISGFRYGFLGINDVPLVTTFGVLVVFIVAFYLICWSLIQRGRGLRS